jgi:hypothetical protein
MVDVLKREDALLDTISTLVKQRNSCKALLDMYMEGGLLMPQVAAHIWDALNGVEREEES